MEKNFARFANKSRYFQKLIHRKLKLSKLICGRISYLEETKETLDDAQPN